jgi:hypothetical protein
MESGERRYNHEIYELHMEMELTRNQIQKSLVGGSCDEDEG